MSLSPIPGSKHEDGTQSDSENALGEQRRDRPWGLWGGAGMKIREGRANVPEGLFAEEDSPARRRKSSTSKATGRFVERRCGSAPHQQSARDECHHHGDDYSDRGTYTIDLENGDQEEEEARKMIDKVRKRGVAICWSVEFASVVSQNNLCVCVCASQVFGVDQQEAVCVSRLGATDQRERVTSQRSGGMGDRGKAGRMEAEVHIVTVILKPSQNAVCIYVSCYWQRLFFNVYLQYVWDKINHWKNKLPLLLCLNADICPLVSFVLSLSRCYLRNWWWVVLAGSHSGLLWLPVTSGQILRGQEGRVTSWLQRTEVCRTVSSSEQGRLTVFGRSTHL